MQTIEFENDLHRRYPPLDENGEEIKDSDAAGSKNNIHFKDGKVNVEGSGNASDIRAKYQQPAPEKSESTVSID